MLKRFFLKEIRKKRRRRQRFFPRGDFFEGELKRMSMSAKKFSAGVFFEGFFGSVPTAAKKISRRGISLREN
ncbi:MAG: hypothetical protein ACOX8R_10790 [Bacillota bacterium]